MLKPQWTKPYVGVSHLQPISKSFQITLEEHQGVTLVYVLSFVSGHAFTPIAEAACETLQEAQQWGEKQYRKIFGV